MSNKGTYEAMTTIQYEPPEAIERWSTFQPGQRFVYPDDVSTPAGATINIEWLIKIKAVRKLHG